jgi:hypothetical protein
MVDLPLNHDVFRTSDHQQMLNVVTANENEPTTSINRNRIDHRQPQLTVACRPKLLPPITWDLIRVFIGWKCHECTRTRERRRRHAASRR